MFISIYLFLLVGYPGDGYICVKIYRMTSSFICQSLGALRQSLLCQEWESKCLSVVHTAAGNYRRVRIGGYSLINCYRMPSGDDRRSTVTVVHKRSDIILMLHGRVRCENCVTLSVMHVLIVLLLIFHALVILWGHEGKLTSYQHLLLIHTHGSSGFSSTGGYVTVSAVTPAFTTRTRHTN